MIKDLTRAKNLRVNARMVSGSDARGEWSREKWKRGLEAFTQLVNYKVMANTCYLYLVLLLVCVNSVEKDYEFKDNNK